jgi:sugar O-acyltransferase (sialic acid O-acetyltransferase NeuD family)
VGAGGLGHEVLQYAQDLVGLDPAWRIKGFLDDDLQATGQRAGTLAVVGTIDGYPVQDEDLFVIAIGNPETRRSVAERLSGRGARFASIVHPRAYVAPTALIEAGCVVCPMAFVGPYARLGAHAVLNVYASAGHDSQVGDFTVLSPYATINGHAVLESGVFLGTHATVLVGKRVGRGAKISAGAVASRDIPAGALAVGNPAKSRVMFRTGE